MSRAGDILQTAAVWTVLIAFDVVVGALVPLTLLAPFLIAVAVGSWSLWPMLELTGALSLFGAVVGTPPVFVAQVWYGRRAAVDRIDGEFGSTAELAAGASLQERVERLSAVAGCHPPLATVLDSDEPNSFAVGRGGTARVYVTRGLLERLAGEELDAVLAHELAHLRNRDTTLLAAAQFVPATTGRWLGTYADAGLMSGRTNADDIARGGARGLFWYLMPVIPVVAAVRVVSLIALRVLARSRERAADRAAARLCGSPAAFATALETVEGEDRPRADARFDAARIRESCLVAREDRRAVPSTRGWLPVVRRYWRLFEARIVPDSHPSTAARIDRLRETAVDGET